MDKMQRARGFRDALASHGVQVVDGWTLPASVNLIEGKPDQVIALLDSLAYGDTTEAVMMRNRKEQWRRKMAIGEQATREYYAKKKTK